MKFVYRAVQTDEIREFMEPPEGDQGEVPADLVTIDGLTFIRTNSDGSIERSTAGEHSDDDIYAPGVNRALWEDH